MNGFCMFNWFPLIVQQFSNLLLIATKILNFYLRYYLFYHFFTMRLNHFMVNKLFLRYQFSEHEEKPSFVKLFFLVFTCSDIHGQNPAFTLNFENFDKRNITSVFNVRKMIGWFGIFTTIHQASKTILLIWFPNFSMYFMHVSSDCLVFLFFYKRRAKCTKRGPRPPLLVKKGAPANFLRGSRQFFDTEITDRVFLRYRYGIGNTGEIPTEYRPKIPNWYTTLEISVRGIVF